MITILVVVLIIIFYPMIRKLFLSPEDRAREELRKLESPTTVYEPIEGYNPNQDEEFNQSAQAVREELRTLENPSTVYEPIEGYSPNQDEELTQSAQQAREELRKLKEQEQN